MEIDLKDNIEIGELGTKYYLPEYTVDHTGLKELPTKFCITFVRGSKLGEGIEKVDGILHEGLLEMMITDLKYKNSLVPSNDTSIIIRHLEDAQLRLLKRQIDRTKRNVIGTYGK